MKTTASISMFIVLLAFFAGAEDISVSMTTGKTNLAEGERIRVTLTVKGAEDNIPQPELPSSDYYDVINRDKRQSSSTSISIINGQMKKKVSVTTKFVYVLHIKKSGDFTLNGPVIAYKGKEYKSNSIDFTVSKGDRTGRSPGSEKGEKQKDHLTTTLRINRSELYRSEQAALTFTLWYKHNAPVDLNKEAITEVVEKLDEELGKKFAVNRLFDREIEQGNKTVNGVHKRYLRFRFSVTPLESGKVKIGPIPFNYNILIKEKGGRQDVFSSFFNDNFFGRNAKRVPKTAYSNPLTVSVKELPEPPDDFSGSVGNISMNSSLNRTSLPAGETVVMNLSIKGNCRPSALQKIEIKSDKKFETYPPETQTQIDTTSSGIYTKKRYSWIIKPKEQGKYSAPEISYTYFDPDTGKYTTLKTGGQELNVSKGTGMQSSSSGRYLTKKEVLETGSDIRYIDTEINLKTKRRKPYTSPMLILLFPIPFIIFLFSLLYRFQARHRERNAGKIIKSKSTKNAVKELTRVDKGKYRKDWISDVSNTLIRFLSKRFSVNAFSMTTEELQSLINKKTGDQELSEKYCELLNRLDSERFGGGPGINKSEFIRSTIEAIKTVNRKGHKE